MNRDVHTNEDRDRREGSCLGAPGGTGRLIVRDALAKAIPLLPWFARRPAPWISSGADMIEGDARDEGALIRALGVSSATGGGAASR